MYTITADTIGPAHEKVVKLIMSNIDNSNEVETEDNEQTFEYEEPVNIHINRPWMDPQSSPALQFGELSLNDYKDQILKIRPLVDRPGKPDFSYLYSNLIFDFPWGEPFPVYDKETKRFLRIDWPHGNGRGDGTNQIDYVIKKLVGSQTSRRAVVSLFEPRGHPMMDDPPCLNEIQFMIRNDQLNCHALFRSNDMLSAWGANAYGLEGLHQHVWNRIKWETRDRFDGREKLSLGNLETTSISAHIYWKRDYGQLGEFKKRWC